MLAELLPAAAAVAESFADLADARLYPEEEAAIARAVPARRKEFITGRACARTALRRLGQPERAIVPGSRREPLWPAGIVGTITHCTGYRGAAVAFERNILALGADAEPHDELPPGVLATVASPAERARLADLTAREPGRCWDRLLFCAKEAVYKVWYPLTGQWLGFAGASIEIDPSAGTFTARLTEPNPITVGDYRLTGFTGRWMIRDGLILTAIAVPADDAGQ